MNRCNCVLNIFYKLKQYNAAQTNLSALKAHPDSFQQDWFSCIQLLSGLHLAISQYMWSSLLQNSLSLFMAINYYKDKQLQVTEISSTVEHK